MEGRRGEDARGLRLNSPGLMGSGDPSGVHHPKDDGHLSIIHAFFLSSRIQDRQNSWHKEMET